VVDSGRQEGCGDEIFEEPSRWASKMILQAVSEARNATANNYLKVLKMRRFLLRSHQQPVGKRGVEGFYNDE
jgi:hypothetical protein